MSSLPTKHLKVWCGPWLAAIVLACGGSVEPQPNAEPMADCGPHGSLHVAADGDAHCHCDSGYTEQDGSCELVVPPPPPRGLDCGSNGTASGRGCTCEPGYTQTASGDARTCEALPSCQGTDDDYEPNSQPTDAQLLPASGSSLYACPGDDDWFVFAVAAGDRVSVEITFDGRAVDLDLYIFDPGAAEPRGRSISTENSQESASFVASEGGTAGVLVTPYGIGEGGYQITVSIEAGEPPMCAGPGGSCRAGADCCSGQCHVGHCH